jgi:hypothetical protein
VPFVLYSGRKEIENNLPEFSGAPWVQKPEMPGTVIKAVIGLTSRPRALL